MLHLFLSPEHLTTVPPHPHFPADKGKQTQKGGIVVSLPWGIDDTAHRIRPTEFNCVYDSDDLEGNMGIWKGNVYGMVVVRVQA